MTISIIVARGGSKRLPRKNVKPFCGHPLVSWSIIQSLCSQEVNLTVVSTDDDEIENISKAYGAEVIRRPNWPDADQCAANKPFIHAIELLQAKYGSQFDTVITILPTTPLNKPEDMDRAIRLFHQYGCDTLRPLIPRRETVVLERVHEYRARLKIFDKKYKYLGESSGWSLTSPNWYLEFNRRLPMDDASLDKMANNIEIPQTEYYFYPTEVWQCMDVDTAEEFELAELMMEYYILKGKGMDVYFEYAQSYKKNPIEESLEKYGGNLNQIK